MSAITVESVVNKDSELISSKIDDEVVMMSIKEGKYFALNGVGTRVWELLETEHTVNAICEKLCAEFKVDLQVCETDVLAYLEDLKTKRLITVS